MADIICSGFGGQGVLTAGMLLIHAGAKAGKQVSFSPSYGSEMRGGTANCNVIISDREIGSPYLNACDVLIALNEPSVDKFENALRDGGMLFVNSSIISPERKFSDKIKVYFVDATEIANELENPKGANLVILGAAVKAGGIFSEEIFSAAVEEYFEKKGKNNPKNAQCLKKGYASVQD